MTLRFERTLGQPRIVRLSSNKRLAHGGLRDEIRTA